MMKTKEITICGKQVTLAYCYATEIVYKDIANEEMTDFILQAFKCFEEKKDPDMKHTLSAIFACIMVYVEANTDAGKETIYPVTLKNLMNEATPTEVGLALLAIIDLRAQFYHVAKSDEEQIEQAEKEGGKKKV